MLGVGIFLKACPACRGIIADYLLCGKSLQRSTIALALPSDLLLTGLRGETSSHFSRLFLLSLTVGSDLQVLDSQVDNLISQVGLLGWV